MKELPLREIARLIAPVAVPLGGVYVGLAVVRSPNEGIGLLAGGLAALCCIAFTARAEKDRDFLLRLVLLALALRWLVALGLYFTHQHLRVAPDAITYDETADVLYQSWIGQVDPNTPGLLRHKTILRSGWGMYYYVGAIYAIFGRVPLATQLINCALGALACVFVYKIAEAVFPNLRVARVAAILTAVSPSMVLWTSLGLKEAPIVLCLCLCTYYTLRLCRKFELSSLAILLLAMFCLFSLRHYAFMITFVAIAGALIFSAKKLTPGRTLQGFALVIVLGLTFVYFGAGEVVQKSMDIQKLQRSRTWGAKAANSGYGGDVDITETRSALIYLPLGVVYVLCAPLPWMIKNVGQLATLPELIVWWAAILLMLKGYLLAIRQRFREALPLCLLTVGLTLTYALLQTNFGTVHRQRAQLFPFFFIFVSIGWEHWRVTRRARRPHHPPLGSDLAPRLYDIAPGQYSRNSISSQVSS